MGNGEKEESCRHTLSRKKEREQEDSCSSESSVHKKRKVNPLEMWWNNEWDESFLNILEKEYLGNTNRSWACIARRLKEVHITDPLVANLTPDDCKERGKMFRKKYRQTEGSIVPNSQEEQLRRIYSKKIVPKFPQWSANPPSTSSLYSRALSRSSSKSKKSKSVVKHWKSNIARALSKLVSCHNLKFEVLDDITERLNTETKVMVFLELDQAAQLRQATRWVGPDACMSVESPPSASTQLVDFSP